MVVLAIRGGLIFQYRPLAPIDASRYASSDNTPLVVNTPFSVIRTFSKQSTLERINYFTSPRTLETTFSPISLPLAVSDSTSVVDTMKKTNIMVIMLESFSEEYIGFLNPTEKSFTPFLDSLAQKSVVYQGMANGKRSIESMPSLLAGIPTFMDEPYITSSYSMNKIEGAHDYAIDLHKKIVTHLISRDAKSAISLYKNNGEYNIARMKELFNAKN
jgi:hypothetical protein